MQICLDLMAKMEGQTTSMAYVHTFTGRESAKH